MELNSFEMTAANSTQVKASAKTATPHADEVYFELMRRILAVGEEKSDRTGTGTRSIFGHQMRFDLSKGFPLLTTKKCHTRSIIHELLWFLKGDTNIAYLKENKVGIWDEWADAEGNLGPVYGQQWRAWKTADGRTIDQIKNVVEAIKANPDSRRHLVVAFNPGDVDKQALPPCHSFFQFYVGGVQTNGRRKLSLQMYQRSADVFLGVPFNIASYALLCMMVAQVCDLDCGEFIHTLGDAHLYSNHMDQTHLQLTREPRPMPQMKLNTAVTSIFDFKFEDFELVGYDPHPSIKAEVAV